MKQPLLLFLLSCSSLVFSQNEKALKGKLTAGKAGELEGITIANKQTKKTVMSDKNGSFTIRGNVGDTLYISAVQYQDQRLVLQAIDFETIPFIVPLTVKVRALDEVVVAKQTITSESLGLVLPGQKKYTTAERRLKTAGDFKPIQLLGLLGGQLPFDPILNAISGKTTRLKKELEVERRELLTLKLQYWFKEDYLVEELKIPKENIDGFWIYTLDDLPFKNAVKSQNKTLATFLVTELAVKYLKIIAE